MIAQRGDDPAATYTVTCCRRKHAWYGYLVLDGAIHTTGPLDPDEEGFLWAWGRTRSADALLAAAALR